MLHPAGQRVTPSGRRPNARLRRSRCQHTIQRTEGPTQRTVQKTSIKGHKYSKRIQKGDQFRLAILLSKYKNKKGCPKHVTTHQQVSKMHYCSPEALCIFNTKRRTKLVNRKRSFFPETPKAIHPFGWEICTKVKNRPHA